jgi:competence protein ComEC
MKLWKNAFALLSLILAAVIIAIFNIPGSDLHIIACNVGQGDAVLIIYGTTQILTDGGPDKSVLTCLGKYMPYWDREIELVISTHPDSDHSTGLVSVLQNYQVDEILINPIDPGTQVYQALVSEVGGRGITVINPIAGMQLGIGLIYLDILNPTDRLINELTIKNPESNLTKYDISEKTNLYSIAYKLSFKEFNGLFLGDIPSEISDQLLVEQSISPVEYIKVPHHGSVNGLTDNLLKATVPKALPAGRQVAIISVGKNPWGFPRPEILDMLSKYNIDVLRTDLAGDVEVITDGNEYWIR